MMAGGAYCGSRQQLEELSPFLRSAPITLVNAVVGKLEPEDHLPLLAGRKSAPLICERLDQKPFAPQRRPPRKAFISRSTSASFGLENIMIVEPGSGPWSSARYFVLSVAPRGWSPFWLAHIHGLGVVRAGGLRSVSSRTLRRRSLPTRVCRHPATSLCPGQNM
jgi:hypothetical protein